MRELFSFPPLPVPAPAEPGRKGIGSHQSAAAATTTWLTPPPILEALGTFDLDPCAAPAPRPWATARVMNSEADGDGLAMEWDGRVFVNPPYTSSEIEAWLRKLADHDRGVALIFARTETAAFHRQVWGRASGLLFLSGRLHFHRPVAPNPERCRHEPHVFVEYAPKAFACGNCGMAKANGGAPSVLCAYGPDDMDQLAASTLDGAFVPLRFARFALVAGLDGIDSSWSEIMADWIRSQPGPVSVSDAYRRFARHPKARGRRHWRPQVRKVLAKVGTRVDRDRYVGRSA